MTAGGQWLSSVGAGLIGAGIGLHDGGLPLALVGAGIWLLAAVVFWSLWNWVTT